jgi:hypothetical protein
MEKAMADETIHPDKAEGNGASLNTIIETIRTLPDQDLVFLAQCVAANQDTRKYERRYGKRSAQPIRHKGVSSEEYARIKPLQDGRRNIDLAWIARCKERGDRAPYRMDPFRFPEQKEICEKAALAGQIPDFDELLRLGDRINQENLRKYYEQEGTLTYDKPNLSYERMLAEPLYGEEVTRSRPTRDGIKNAKSQMKKDAPADDHASDADDAKPMAARPSERRSDRKVRGATGRKAKVKPVRLVDDKELWALIKDMLAKGMTQTEIVEALAEQGRKVSQPSLSIIIKKWTAREKGEE